MTNVTNQVKYLCALFLCYGYSSLKRIPDRTSFSHITITFSNLTENCVYYIIIMVCYVFNKIKNFKIIAFSPLPSSSGVKGTVKNKCKLIMKRP